MAIGIGSVVQHENSPELFVITDVVNYEDEGSCSYDRDYWLIPLKIIKNKEYIDEYIGTKFPIRGTKMPFIEVKTVAPFEIKREVKYKVGQRKSKTITIYE